MPGFYNQLQKVHFGSYTGPGVPEDPSKHGKNGNEPTAGKYKDDLSRGGEVDGGEAYQRQEAVTPTGEMTATTQRIPLAPLFCRYMYSQECLARSLDHYRTTSPGSPSMRKV